MGGVWQDGSWVETSSPGRAVGVGFVEEAVALTLEEWEKLTEGACSWGLGVGR